MNTYCTVASKVEINLLLQIFEDLQQIDPHSILHVLWFGKGNPQNIPTNLVIVPFDKTKFHYEAALIFRKYRFHTALKMKAVVPVFLRFLIDTGFQKVFYFDLKEPLTDDLPKKLDLLDSSHIILTTKRFPTDNKGAFPYQEYFTRGHYKSSLIGFHADARQAVNWWQDMCLFRMKKKKGDGLYDFGSYLNMFPLLFDSVHIEH